MINSGIAPSVIDEQDYFELLEIMRAQAPEDRPVNTVDAHKKMAQMFS